MTLVINQAQLDALLNGPNGPVARMLARKGAQIEGSAKRLASGELVNVDTGRYRASITWRLFTKGNTPGVAIGSGVHYGEFLEFGTKHLAARQVLRTAARENGINV